MQISISKFTGFVAGAVGILLVLVYGYFAYNILFSGNEVISAPSASTINTSALGPKMQKAASVLVNASDKIALKQSDLAFTQSELFKSFTDTPSDVPLSGSRGRPDPFLPYVAP